MPFLLIFSSPELMSLPLGKAGGSPAFEPAEVPVNA